MHSLKKLGIKPVYRTGKDDLYNDFYKPALSASVSYDRAVGFFNSEILSINISGVSHLVKSNGTMRLLIGDPLAEDEFDAVKHGMLLKEVSNNLSQKLEDFLLNHGNDKRLQLLSLLIASGRLEIKFALRRQGMYHEKIGIFRDRDSNTVVFQGSANETPHGMIATLNAESISVYKSWEPEIFSIYGVEFIEGFERLWNNLEENTVVLDVPSTTYQRISEKVSSEAYSIENIEDIEELLEGDRVIREKPKP